MFAQPGALRAAQLEQVIEGMRDLDMDEVRAAVASQDDDTSGARR